MSDFKDHTKGQDWHYSARVFPLMCPLTKTNCHSLCVCYRDANNKETAIGGKPDVFDRMGKYTRGRCDHFNFAISYDAD